MADAVGNIEETTEEVKTRGIKNSTDDKQFRLMSPRRLHGRKQIFTNEKSVTASNLLTVLNKAIWIHRQNREEEEYLEKYLRGIQPIIDRRKEYNAEICNRIVVNIASQIVSFKTSEFAGNPIQYISRGKSPQVPEKLEKLNSMMLTEGKKSKDFRLAHDMFTYGVGYRLILSDKAYDAAEAVKHGVEYEEAPFEIYIPDARNTFVIRLNDVSKKIVAAVTYVFLDESQTDVEYTVYTGDVTYTVRGTALTAAEITAAKPEIFSMIPIVEYPCNVMYMGAFEVVLPLLDAYNSMTSNRLDGVEQFIQALMIFKGVDISREDFLKLKDLGAITLPAGMDGRSAPDIEFLSEQLDQTQTQTLIDDLYQMILQIVGMPSQGNANTSDSSNNGAMIIKNGWWNAEARRLESEGMWDMSEMETLKLVLTICREANVLDGLKVSDVMTKFGAHSYEDKLVKSQSFTTLIGVGVPPIQAYKYSGLDSDPEAAALQFEAYQAEQEAKAETKMQEELDRERERIAQYGNNENAGTVQTERFDDSSDDEETAQET